jgi:hypothetical protein
MSVSELFKVPYATLQNRIEAILPQQKLQNGISGSSGETSNINLGWPPVSLKHKTRVLFYKTSLTMKGKPGLLCSLYDVELASGLP